MKDSLFINIISYMYIIRPKMHLSSASGDPAHSPLPGDRINFEHNLSFPLSVFHSATIPLLFKCEVNVFTTCRGVICFNEWIQRKTVTHYRS